MYTVMSRSIGAVFAGLVVTIIAVVGVTWVTGTVTGMGPGMTPSRDYLLLNLAGSVAAAMAGGFVAAAVAEHTPTGHAAALSVVVLILSFPSVFIGPVGGQPAWYPWVLSVVGPAGVVVGGVLAARFRGNSSVEDE